MKVHDRRTESSENVSEINWDVDRREIELVGYEEDESTVMYDPQSVTAWIKSDVVVSLDEYI